MKYPSTMRVKLVACIFLAVAGMVTGEPIAGSFNRIDIKVPNPITITTGEAAIDVGPEIVQHQVDADLLTISEVDSTANTTAPVMLTVPFANIIEIMGEGAQIAMEDLTAGSAQFTLNVGSDSAVTGKLSAPNIKIIVIGSSVDLTGSFGIVDLAVRKAVTIQQEGGSSGPTVKLNEITGEATADIEPDSNVNLTLGPNAKISGVTASPVCVTGGTCSLTAAAGFTGTPCSCGGSTPPGAPGGESPASPGTPPPAPPGPPGPSPASPAESASPWGCKHYHFWILHTHEVDCSKAKTSDNEYVKWLCHTKYCN